MQSKISTFFKSGDPVLAAIDGDEDELAIWEKKEHHIFNTYEQRNSNPKICSICSVKFAPGDAEDEKAHKNFHITYTEGLPFKRWTNERIVHMLNGNGDRIILVLQTDPPAQKKKVEEVGKMMEIDLGTEWIIHGHCKVYLFISLHRIVGCLVAEPIKEGFKVISCSNAGSSDGSRKKETNPSSTTLQFGDIIFRREVGKRASSVNESAGLDTTHGGAIFCEGKAVTAVCGIRAIWVTSSNRRKRIANQLLDAVRKSFCLGFVIEHSQLAFSQPTTAGMALASSYSGTGSFLVYRAPKTGS